MEGAPLRRSGAVCTLRDTLNGSATEEHSSMCLLWVKAMEDSRIFQEGLARRKLCRPRGEYIQRGLLRSTERKETTLFSWRAFVHASSDEPALDYSFRRCNEPRHRRPDRRESNERDRQPQEERQRREEHEPVCAGFREVLHLSHLSTVWPFRDAASSCHPSSFP